MKPLLARRLLLIVLLISAAVPASSGAELRTALVIGNSAYRSGPLKNPANDATDMAAALQKAGFTVTLKKNAKLREMEEAIEGFGNSLKRGGVGLFYFAGHGVQVNGVNYLLPVGARINKESDVKYEAVDANRILDEMAGANNGLNIVMLDACRDNPFARSFRSASRGLAIVSSAPTGTFISYSTGPGQVARDGEGRNSPYTGALLQHMPEPGLSIEQMFKKVRASLGKKTAGGQIPWELSSLQGDFYFMPAGSGRQAVSAVPEQSAAADELRAERARLEAEREQLRKEKDLLEQRKAAGEEKKRIEGEKKQVAIVEPSVSAGPKNIREMDRFVAKDDGTVLDTKTNLMWAARDNGSDITWPDAKSYCETYHGGGYADWRMPTADELKGLYDSTKTYSSHCPGLNPNVHLTDSIRISCVWVWASGTREMDHKITARDPKLLSGLREASTFYFGNGTEGWSVSEFGTARRALPVRLAKKASTVKEIGRDGKYVAYDNGTVLDTKANLMWASKDNGGTITWEEAKRYCENYRGGGYKDWRMPTQEELSKLYDRSLKGYSQECGTQYNQVKLTNLIHLTCYAQWASERQAGQAGFVYFTDGVWSLLPTSGAATSRVLPVRSTEVKKESRFVNNGNNTITDTKTGLMWAATDNWNPMHWENAKNYCRTFSYGGFTDWRLPTTDELKSLYDETKKHKAAKGFYVNVTELIEISHGSVWTSDTRSSEAAYFDFINGKQGWYDRSYFVNPVLPVRSAR